MVEEHDDGPPHDEGIAGLATPRATQVGPVPKRLGDVDRIFRIERRAFLASTAAATAGVGALSALRAFAGLGDEPIPCDWPPENPPIQDPDDPDLPPLEGPGLTTDAKVTLAMAAGALTATSAWLINASVGLAAASLVPEPGTPLEVLGAGGTFVGGAFTGALAALSGWLASDPPREEFDFEASKYPIDVGVLPFLDQLGLEGRSHLEVLANEVSLNAAILDAVELMSGAWLAGDMTWARTHYDRAYELIGEHCATGPDVVTAMRWFHAEATGLVSPALLGVPLPTQAEVDAMAGVADSYAEITAVLQPAVSPGGYVLPQQATVMDPALGTLQEALLEADAAVEDFANARQTWYATG